MTTVCLSISSRPREKRETQKAQSAVYVALRVRPEPGAWSTGGPRAPGTSEVRVTVIKSSLNRSLDTYSTQNESKPKRSRSLRTPGRFEENSYKLQNGAF